jgi:hypothetical protein
MTTQLSIQKVTTAAQAKALYDCSALTWEGLESSPASLGQVLEWMNGLGVDTCKAVFNVMQGAVMNTIYGLTGTNAYPKETTIVSVTGIDVGKLIIPRFQVGGKWFDDIVDNNRRRQTPDADDE